MWFRVSFEVLRVKRDSDVNIYLGCINRSIIFRIREVLGRRKVRVRFGYYIEFWVKLEYRAGIFFWLC